MPENLSDRLPDRMLESMSGRMSEYMPDKMPENMSGTVPENSQIDCWNISLQTCKRDVRIYVRKISENMSYRISELMPE